MIWAAWFVLLAHLAVNGVHAVAHLQLGLNPTPAEGVFIAAFIYGGPIAAVVLLGRGRARAAMGLMAVSLLGSLAFATHHHFLVVSPDHVDHLPAGAGQLAFRVTAYLAEPIAALGVIVGAVGFLSRRRAAGLEAEPPAAH